MEHIKRILTGMLLLSFVLCTYASSELVIGEGVTESRTPINYYYLNTYQGCQMIFTADELAEMGDEAIIQGFKFYYENASSSVAPTTTLEIRIGKTSSTYFSYDTALQNISNMTLVNTITIGGWKASSSGWEWIPINDFKYNKGENIIVDIRNTSKSSTTNNNVYFTATSCSSYKTLSWTSASSASTTYISSGTRTKLRPNTKILYKTYSSLTEVSGFLNVNCTQPGQLCEQILSLNNGHISNKLKVTGIINNEDINYLIIRNLQDDTDYIDYLDLSEATIVACNGKYAADDNEIILGGYWRIEIYKLVLPDGCTKFSGEASIIYTRNPNPFEVEARSEDSILRLHCPSNSKPAWRKQLGDLPIIIDTPVKTIKSAYEINNLTQEERNTIDAITVDYNCNINAAQLRILSQMPELEDVSIYGSITSYYGTEGPNYGTYTVYHDGELPDNTFKDNCSIREVYVMCTTIGNYCFQNAKNLQRFHNTRYGVTSGYIQGINVLGNYAFDGCSNLNFCALGALTSVGDFALRNTQVMAIRISHCTWEDDGYSYDKNASTYAPITYFGKCPLFGCPPCWQGSRYGAENPYMYEASYSHQHQITLHTTWGEESWLTFNKTLVGFSDAPRTKIQTLNFQSIADWAFCDLHYIKSVNLGSEVQSIGEAFLYRCPELSEIASSSTSYTAIDNVLFNSDCTTLLKYPSARDGKSYKIPGTVTQLTKWSFESMKNLTDLYVCSSTPIELEDGVFEDTDLSKMTLHVPFGTRDAYAAADGWKEFGTIVEGNSITHVEMTDKSDVHDSFDISTNEELTIMDEWKQVTISDDIDNISVNYSRTYKNTNWQAWFVPFELELTSDLMDRFSFAKFAGTYTDGGEFFITIAMMNAGDMLKANTPYFIKAKTADTTTPQVISIDNAVLHKTEETGFAMYSAEKKIDIHGIYSIKEATENDIDWYAYSAGKYSHPLVGAKLNPFRFYLTITDRDDNPYAIPSSMPVQINIMVIGEDDEANGVSDIVGLEGQNQVYYNLNGQKVTTPTAGIYIKNGKKVFIK